MKVLVTGAAGFIGKHVVKALREVGHDVLTLDCVGDVDFHVDITQPIAFLSRVSAEADMPLSLPLPKMEGLDAVIHLAALSHPRQCDENPSKAFDVNVNGTSNVLGMALKSGAKKFVFSSSAHVFDIPPSYLPTDEIHPLRLNNVYTTTKILGEQLCHLYWENHGLGYTTLRLFNAYGNGQSLGYLIPDLIAKAQSGKVELHGSNVTKDWVYIDDVVDAFMKAVSSVFVGPVNVGTGIETDLGSIARIIASAYQVELDAKPAAVPTRMCADRGRAERILGWSPKVSLEDGLRRILQVPMRAEAKET